MNIATVSHLIAAGAFLALTLVLTANVLTAGARGRRPGILLVGASAVTTVWAAVTALDAWGGTGGWHALDSLGILRSATWIVFLWAILEHVSRQTWAMQLRTLGLPALAALCLVVIGFDVYPELGDLLGLPCYGSGCAVYGHLLIAVFGLVLVENVYRNSTPDGRWNTKYLCFGLGGLFAFDIFLFAEGVLVHAVDADLLAARGVVNALIVPLIAVSAVRNRDWPVDVFVSRGAVFHSATLLGAGLYMLLMAAAGDYLRGYGGAWGPLLQTSFLFAALAVLAVVLSSERVRSELRVFVSKHFFDYKYDYREEWLRFTATISDAGRDADLRDRAIRAVADLVDSPDGGLWLRDDRGSLVHAATWNQAWPSEDIPMESPFGRLLGEERWVIHLDGAGALPPAYSRDVIPAWMRESRRAWLAVPLVHDDRLLGFMLLGRPRAPRELNWEDYDLLKTVGRQAAGYLALEQTTKALIESRQFESFNRRFAFVLHDVKNLVSQLSLMVKNADRFGGDPAFQDDMIETVRESVEKMNRMLARLHSGQEGHATLVRLDELLRAVVASKGEVAFGCDDPAIAAAVDADRLTAVVEHLVQNGLDAAPAGSAVRVRLRSEPGHAIIEIEDDGPGMDARFVRDQLFQPFRTTKVEGYGIGAYESREFAREMGGWLDVDSEPGRGTVMRLVLPAIAGEAAPDADGRKVGA